MDTTSLTPSDIKQLYQKGSVSTYYKSRQELQHIRMPVGGLFCGGVYLRGDGVLVDWDIDPNFQHLRNILQGFSIHIQHPSGNITRPFDEDSWPEIAFEATYPVATIAYIDPSLPVTIKLEVYSPLIPLNETDSSLPLTVFNFHVQNNDSQPISAHITGWLENKLGGVRINTALVHKKWKGVHLQGTAEGEMNFCIAAIRNDAIVQTQQQQQHSIPCVDTYSTQQESETLLAGVTTQLQVLPGQHAATSFVNAWYYPGMPHYHFQFPHLESIVEYFAENFQRLQYQTQLWKKNMADTTLPNWLVERCFMQLATLTNYTLSDYKFGGVHSLGGVKEHDFPCEQLIGRLFPTVSQQIRLLDGEVHPFNNMNEISTFILRCYREHLLSYGNMQSVDQKFIIEVYPYVQKAIKQLIEQYDHDQLSSLALKAAYQLAKLMHDEPLAVACLGHDIVFEEMDMAAAAWSTQLQLQHPVIGLQSLYETYLETPITENAYPYQLAMMLIHRGMHGEALNVLHLLHEHYHPSARNPFNISEPGSLASWGVMVNIMGFVYDGQRGFISFAPVWGADQFKAPFIVAEGWGSYKQLQQRKKQVHEVFIKYGMLEVTTLRFQHDDPTNIHIATVALEGKKVPAKMQKDGRHIIILLSKPVIIPANQALTVTLT
ncbi:beta-glucocerebrosidase 2-like protein [Chitinophaga skermanii]|uniref:Beta-glucocerebrosidase 2-like protein n=1 Tax=Chitinophaga skermanii TaxID=331697 RepID=A0A327QEZ3_9BACT|nr:GH116 family glycosyl-hydrolase [Chitinophaga skermanii]RAJ02448.1 beta-glucocerebrosidase 2-like protein [Chitinophaga skermanii]